MIDIYRNIVDLIEQRIPFVLCTVIEAKGSTPGKQNFKMAVTMDGKILGTIGGGLMEAIVIKECSKALQEEKSKIEEFVLDHKSTKGIDMYCGGQLKVFMEVFLPAPQIIILGGGHIGLEAAKLCTQLGYSHIVMDSREEFCSAHRFPSTTSVIHGDYDNILENIKIDNQSYIVIVTHNSDQRCLEQVIKTDAKYIGMIGSKKKILQVFDNMKEKGFNQEDLDRVYSPIGLDIKAQSPAEIALSIMAQIIKVSKNPSPISKGEEIVDE
jgi:xanthine dehydrogenase accessory factor